MSTFTVPVVRYTLEKHPNADTLSIAHIKGWTCIVRTADFEARENSMYSKGAPGYGLGVYVPLDAVADKEHPLLSFLEGKKIKAIRLRGVFSQGVLLPLEQVVNTFPLAFKKFPEEGDDLAEILQIKKYEPPVRPTTASVKGAEGHVEVVRPTWLHRYTDIENYNNYTETLQPGEEVEATLKLHGTSAIFALINNEFYICSRNRCLRTKSKTIRVPRFTNKKVKKVLRALGLENLFGKKKVLPPPDSVWHKAFKQFDLENKLRYLSDLASFHGNDYPAVAIYGEIIGVQDLMYGLNKGEIDFYVYDIRIEGRDPVSDYVDPDDLTAFCADLGLKKVPILYRGPFTPEVLELRNGPDPIGKTHVREGIVVKPVVNRVDSYVGRVVLKRIGEDYLLRKNDQDESEFSLE